MPEDETSSNGEQPPEDVRRQFEQFRYQDVLELVAKTEIFPRQLISLKHHQDRTSHVITVIRFWLAHPDSGIRSFRGAKGRRLKAYHWTCSETGTSLSQLEREIAEIYDLAENPHGKFTEHLKDFENILDERIKHC